MKRLFVLALVTATAVVGATVAEAAIRSGTFTGKTTAGDPLGFKVNSSGRARAFFFSGVTLTCSDGEKFDSSTNRSPSKSTYRIDSSNRFTISITSTKTGFGWTVHGRFTSSGGSASGTLRALARFDIENNLNPKGSVKCDSGKLNWTAKRR
jgi:hypothetical protein